MLFAISKLIGFLVLPSTLICLVIFAGLLRARSLRPAVRQRGLRIACVGASLLALPILSPIANWVIWPLEARFSVPDVPDGSRDYAGIIVLGGGEEADITSEWRQLSINEAGDRITTASTLAKRLPDARLVFTGGSASLLSPREGGAAAVRAYWMSIGIPPSCIVIEQRSRNTYENAMLTHALLSPKRGDRFLLVTSAAHMPRSMGIFRRAGFDVVAYPTDFRINPDRGFIDLSGSYPAGLKRLDEAAREWFGLVAYRILGRTDELFPGPR